MSKINSEIKPEISIQNKELPVKNVNENVPQPATQTNNIKKDSHNPKPNPNSTYHSLHLKKKTKKKNFIVFKDKNIS